MFKYNHHIQFFTATCLEWKQCLANEYHKQIIIEALQHRVKNNQLIVYGFVIMPNHFHIIWRIDDELLREDFQRDFMKFTSRSILNFMKMNNDPMHQKLVVNARDRHYQLWERNALSIDLLSEAVLLQKLNYIHNNPLQEKWKLCSIQEEYFYSSAKFYETGESDFEMLTHFKT
jgi:REP element-mobilizing transposase RayT